MTAAKGIIVPMVTPLQGDGNLDLKGTEKLINHLINGGVHGLFILGTTGEGPSLSHAQKLELIKHVCSQVDGRVPVLVGVMECSYREAIDLSEKAKKYGAHAAVFTPPFFYNISQDELYQFADQLIQEIALPVYLYNNPGLTKVAFEIKTVKKLMSKHKIMGVKDSSGNLIYFQRLLKLTQSAEIPLLMGPEELLMQSLLTGGSGGVAGGANAFPRLFVDMYEAATSGQLDKARNLQKKVMKISGIMYSGVGYGSSNVINGIKCCLKYMNICEDFLAKPLETASTEKAMKIKQFLNEK